MAERIQQKRTRGWRMPANARGVARPSRYGNPFRIGGLVRDPGYSGGPAHPYEEGLLPEGRHGTVTIRRVKDAADAVDLFRTYITFHDDGWDPALIRQELAGKDLACWCKPGTPCHADVLLQLANGKPA